MIRLLCNSVGYVTFRDGRKWWGGGSYRQAVVFLEIGDKVTRSGEVHTFSADMTVHAHTPYLGTNCSGLLTVLPNDRVHFVTKAKHVRFDGKCLADESGFEGKISIVGPENLDIENSPIRFGEIEE